MTSLVCQSVDVSIGGKQICSGLEFELSPGQFWGLLGPNGIGKTTLLKCMAGLSRPDSGRVLLENQPMDKLPRRAIARLLGMLQQHTVYIFDASVLETADPVYGGWGKLHKFPHPEAIDFALIRWSQTGDEAMRKLVLRTLRNMQAGEIHDQVEGGFYRYATSPDWNAPHFEGESLLGGLASFKAHVSCTLWNARAIPGAEKHFPAGGPRGVSSVGRALQWHCRGQGFDSPILHHPPPRPAFRDERSPLNARTARAAAPVA